MVHIAISATAERRNAICSARCSKLHIVLQQSRRWAVAYSTDHCTTKYILTKLTTLDRRAHGSSVDAAAPNPVPSANATRAAREVALLFLLH